MNFTYKGLCTKCRHVNIRTFTETHMGPRYLTLCSRCHALMWVFLQKKGGVRHG
jgi:hypothetical protein